MTRCVFSILLLAALAAPAHAQLGEAHLGAVGSFATGSAYQGGAGLTASYAPGRLAYMGVRWIYYLGSIERHSDAAGNWDVTTRAQLFGADVGIQMPLGEMEFVAGATLGPMRFSQRASLVGDAASSSIKEFGTEFVVAPRLMFEIRTGPVKIIPEVSYYFSGSPDLRWHVGNQGLAMSMLVVIPLETDRIRF